MQYLVRKYHTNKDKQNEVFSTLEEALLCIGKKETDIYLKVNWLHLTDVFFRDTKDYIRVNNLPEKN